ncbi:MAG: helix-turn-helix domain-containing protein [Pseudoxanthomonas sp.]|nr:helix-turn-helix domain-containing protein [Pseudoxanthomonas sp.]
MNRKQTQALIAVLGGPAALAAALTEATGEPITSQALSQWGRVPVRWVLPIERISLGKFTRYDIREDVYGVAPVSKGNKAA